ncbi:hypothetical protein KQX54_019217 [Cotesia glomerata]|uniref:Uncharacterized protein n=1 Tax=Cotesia glomerata TaxID=32391 RepID=A0AAV7IDH2_COTGL|nr:hypothetical protein KQX54_019217 [Cotesia glomerata]
MDYSSQRTANAAVIAADAHTPQTYEVSLVEFGELVLILAPGAENSWIRKQRAAPSAGKFPPFRPCSPSTEQRHYEVQQWLLF